MDHAAMQLRIRTSDREKLKFTMIRGEGRMLGGLGGGEPQRRGWRHWPSGFAGSRAEGGC
jgi:hypothetical protein